MDGSIPKRLHSFNHDLRFSGFLTNLKAPSLDRTLDEPMRYFLNIRTQDSLVTDDEGDVFSDMDQLFDHARNVASDLRREYPVDEADAWSVVPVALEVADETGALLFCLPINECGCAGSSHRRNPRH